MPGTESVTPAPAASPSPRLHPLPLISIGWPGAPANRTGYCSRCNWSIGRQISYLYRLSNVRTKTAVYCRRSNKKTLLPATLGMIGGYLAARFRKSYSDKNAFKFIGRKFILQIYRKRTQFR